MLLNTLKSKLPIIIPNCWLVLLQKMKDNLTYVYQSSYETIDVL